MSSPISVKVLFFAKAKDLVQMSTTTLSLPTSPYHTTGTQLTQLILSQFPQLRDLGDTFVLAVNQQYIDINDSIMDIVIANHCEIAVIPPLSGG
jgi:molybdopterin converting factor subunit 1